MMIVGSYGTGEIIGKDEETFIILRQWAGMQSMILITKKLGSGLSNRFVKLNIVVLLHESKSPVFNRLLEKNILSKDRFFVNTKKELGSGLSSRYCCVVTRK